MGSGRDPDDPGARRRAGLGAIAGVLAAGTALGVGQLVAGLTGATGSPVVAVGQLQIDFTPPWLKNFAINEFGSDDKLVLVSGILVVLGIFAALIGVAATRRLAYGMAGLVVFAAIGLTAAATRPTATVSSVLPTLAATAAAAVVLRVLIGRIGPPVTAGTLATPQAWPDSWGDTGEDDADGADGAAELAAPDLPPAMTGTGGVIRPSAAQGRDWLARAPGPSAPVEPARRSFLAASVATAGIAATAGLAGRLLAERSSVATARSAVKIPRPTGTGPALPPGTDLDIPGLASFITPNNDFYRVDTAIVLPEVDPSSWQLRIHGMVSREITITFDELLRRPLIEDYVTLCCVSNPVGGPYIGNAKWLGASLASLLRQAGIKAGADQLMCTSVDGFTSGTPVQTVMDGRDALLAVAMNGQPLPIAHGFPARMVVPGLYGYVSATKWVTDINVTTFAGELRLLGPARLVAAGADQDRVPHRRAERGKPDPGGTHGGGRRGLGPAQGHRGRGGTGGPGSVEPGPAGRRPRSRHLAAVGLGVGRHQREPRDRGPGDRQDRLHPDRRPGAARTERGHRVPLGRGHGRVSRGACHQTGLLPLGRHWSLGEHQAVPPSRARPRRAAPFGRRAPATAALACAAPPAVSR